MDPRAPRTCIAFALVAALGLGIAGCGREAPARGEQRFADLAAFRAQDRRGDARPRVVAIGLDGASWDYIDPQIAAGRLPHLARLKRDGAWGRLRSVDTHYTPPAWTTMFTGRLPPKTGVYSFGSWDAGAHAFRMVSSRDVAVPAVWDVASAAGLRVAAVGVPVTYPAHPIEGVMVGGLETPKNHGPRLDFRTAEGRFPPSAPAERSFTPPVSAVLEDANNVLFAFFVDSQDDGAPRFDRVELQVVAKGPGPPERRTLGRHAFPLGEFSPWVRVRVERGDRRDDAFVRFQFQAPDGDFGFRVSPARSRRARQRGRRLLLADEDPEQVRDVDALGARAVAHPLDPRRRQVAVALDRRGEDRGARGVRELRRDAA
jgi:hypothetical protein